MNKSQFLTPDKASGCSCPPRCEPMADSRLVCHTGENCSRLADEPAIPCQRAATFSFKDHCRKDHAEGPRGRLDAFAHIACHRKASCRWKVSLVERASIQCIHTQAFTTCVGL